ncbi:MAG: N-formylglutamate amidohydrolase [Pseudomonadales bacterium]
MIFHIPHSSTLIPEDQRQLLQFTESELAAELLALTDHFTEELFSPHAGPDDVALVFPVSRLVTDVERFSDDADETMSKVGMGAIYTHSSQRKRFRLAPEPSERDALLNLYYVPHHQAFGEAVATQLEKDGTALIIDCHSFPSKALPYEPDQDPDRPVFCIGTDDFHTPKGLVEEIAHYLESAGYSVKVNAPFAGSIVPMAYYGKNDHVHSLMLEINRALYMDETTGLKLGSFDEVKGCVERVVSICRGFGDAQ